MKKAILTTILGLFLIHGLKAQTVTLPTFEGKDVVFKVFENFSQFGLQVSDGITPTYTFSIVGNNKNPFDAPSLLAKAFTQLRNQGFKLITSNVWSLGEVSQAYSYYIFQKD